MNHPPRSEPPVGDAPTARKDTRPTPDQCFLAGRLNGRGLMPNSTETKANEITIPAIQRWNVQYGVVHTTEALRVAWGFPPPSGISNPYAYVAGILRSKP